MRPLFSPLALADMFDLATAPLSAPDTAYGKSHGSSGRKVYRLRHRGE